MSVLAVLGNQVSSAACNVRHIQDKWYI